MEDSISDQYNRREMVVCGLMPKLAFFNSKLLKITSFLSKRRSLVSIHHLASPVECFTDTQFQKPSPIGRIPRTKFLNPQTVLATLHDCPSDLTALNLFLWCARQPHYFHDKPTFHHMVGVLSNLTRRYGTVNGILCGLEPVGCVPKAQTLLLLMRIYWCGEMYDMVLEAFQQMCNHGYVPNTYVRNIVLDVFFKTKHVNAALRVLEETRAPNFLSFSIAVCNLCRLNDVNNVIPVLRSMLMRGYYMNPETYALVLNCFCQYARLEEALQVLSMMIVLGAPVSVNVWSILINGFCKSGKIEVAAYLLEKMVKSGCSPNIVTCTSLIKGFLESEMPGRAFEILSTLESKGCFPDLVLCNVLIHCLSKMGWYKDAFEVFSSLRELQLTPDVYTYSSLVSTICLSRQYFLLPLLTSGLSIEPDLVVCNCLLSYFCKAGYPAGAVEFYNDMLDREFLPDKYSFAGVLNALCQLGRTHEAVNVYRGIIRNSGCVDAHIHTIIINGLLKSGSFHNIIRLFRSSAAENIPLDVVAYGVAIDGLVRGSRMENAYDLFNHMKEVGLVPNKQIYNLMLSGFCKHRDFNMIKRVVQEMVYKNIEIDYHSCKLIGKFLSDPSNSHLAFSLLELKRLGLIPKEEHALLVDGLYNSLPTRFSSLSNHTDALDLATSSSDDLSDAVASVG